MFDSNFYIDEIYDSLDRVNLNFYKKKKILLLGSDGFLGKYFINFFLFLNLNDYNVKVDCVDNNISSSKFTNKYKDKNILFFKRDILKFDSKTKYDVIIYLAGIASPYLYKKFPFDTLKVSYEGMVKYLEKATKDKSTLIFFSSSEIYGNPDLINIPTKESYYGNVNSFGPRSCYDEGKRIGETLCYIYKNYKKTKIKIIRPFNVYGSGMNKLDYRVIPNFIRKIQRKKTIEIFGDGKQTRTFCFISDAMCGFLKVISKGKNGEIYNIGNDNDEISMNNLLKIFQKLLKRNVKYKCISYPSSYPPDEPLRRCPDISKARKDLNFYPKISVYEGVRRYLSELKIK